MSDDAARYDAANLAALFTPQAESALDEDRRDGTRPCLTVAGVQVYVYVTEEGVLRVSLDFDTADVARNGDHEVAGEGAVFDGPCTPVQVAFSGEVVYELDAQGRDITPGRQRCAWCDAPMNRRSDARTCRDRCRMALWRHEQGRSGEAS